jgi:transcriptional regulator with XRE-family HTH domain
VPPTSPTVASWELVVRLRERREHVGIDVKEITRALGFSRNYWSAVENERKILSVDSLTRLVDLFEFDRDERQELLDLREAAKQRGWWARYSGLIGPELQRLFGLEHGAAGIRGYESLLVPGLLQTPDYSRAIMAPDVTVRPVEVDQRVEVRQRRQQRLTGDDPLHLTAILSEAALRQQIGGPAVLRGQLEHLARLIEERSDNIVVRVIPFSATSCGLFGAATVHLIDFDNPMLSTLAWQETVTSQSIIDDPVHVRNISTTYGDALERALSTQDTLKLINTYVKELA